MKRPQTSDSYWSPEATPEDRLTDGSRVGVIGCGPAGSFFAYFLLDMARRVGLDIKVDIFEPRDFTKPGPQGCNMCGGIISETLVQNLAAEGIDLPSDVVQRGIDSYVLHMDEGDVRIDTPLHEKRIGAVHRGPGPRDLKEVKWKSFDGHLQQLAEAKGANMIRGRVETVARHQGRPQVTVRGGEPETFDLLVVAAGVNSPTLKQFQDLEIGYEPPDTTKAFIREYFLGQEEVNRVLGTSMHVFLLDLPRLEFGAIIPKGDYVSVCLLGDSIDKSLIEAFFASPAVRECFPDGLELAKGSCQCSPKINIRGAAQPFADRILFLGDCGVTRLYKDGIGAAYRTAKAAASTVIFEGVSEDCLREHFWPACRKIDRDNAIGRFTFGFTREIQKRPFARRAVMRMTSVEQQSEGRKKRMSGVLWDVFTGSTSYRDILRRTVQPAFVAHLGWNVLRSISKTRSTGSKKEEACASPR